MAVVIASRETDIDDLSRIFHEAPNDIMELIILQFSDVNLHGGNGGMNVLRLVCKRLMGVVESCATRLTQIDNRFKGPDSFPLALWRCKTIEHITCNSRSLRSLEECPNGLKSLVINNGLALKSLEPLRGCTELESLRVIYALHIADVSPLSACTRLKDLTIRLSLVSDISALSPIAILEELDLAKQEHQPSIKDLSPLSQCRRLRKLHIALNAEIEDLSPLAQCTQLEVLQMEGLTKITDLKYLSSLIKLEVLNINDVPVEDLTPLSALQDLEMLSCYGIPHTTSLLPLARCSKLLMLRQDEDAKDLDLLKEIRPDLASY